MEDKNVNNKLRNAIKVRHLAEAISENWQQLANVNERVQNTLDDATAFIMINGKAAAKNKYTSGIKETSKSIEAVDEILVAVSTAVKANKRINPDENWDTLQLHLTAIENDFSAYESYPKEYFQDCNYKDWKDIWKVIKSSLLAVRGISESAYIKARMMNDFNKDELDTLTTSILKNIPKSFSITDADKYEKEYLQAIVDIEKEANQKANLWDRFLNLLAGSIPFKQTPAERVMMERWVDGEKGDL